MKSFFTVFFFTMSFYFINVENLLADGLSVIVNETNPVTEVTENQMGNFFLKKIRQWPNGTPIRFFDQSDDKLERQFFLKNFVKKSSREVELYWIGQKLYTGNSAPLQINTDSIMAGVVARFPGAIGYVSADFAGAPGVKKVSIRRE